MPRELRNGVLGETSTESLARLTQSKVIATYIPSTKTIRTSNSTSYGSRTAPTIKDEPYTISTVPIKAPFYRKEKFIPKTAGEKSLRTRATLLGYPQGLSEIELLKGGIFNNKYYSGVYSTSPFITPTGTTTYSDTQRALRKDNVFQKAYQWLRRDVDTGIQSWLTKDITLRDVYKDVVGVAEPKTITQEISGIIKWVVLGVVAIVVVKVIK